ncbi:MAG TPA: hypothetical protein DGP89_08165 [Saprospirales bacterium]|jgi:hypothetical protein|nr:hypothetical protein [Saprospiraceae bacterium]HCV51308.1 hypothetical protein [Saprospirales bacterium]
MKKLLTLVLFLGMALGVSAQLVNQGGTITIQSGATLVVESDITNTTGSIVNNGIIEVKGDITSEAAASFTSAVDSKLKFSGTTPSTINFMASTILSDVEMAKTAEDLTLASDLDIDGDLTFTEDDNQIILGANNLVLSATSAADNVAVTNSFIVTDGAGVVTKEGLSTAFKFPVGAAIDSQNDITLAEGGTVDDISVRVLTDAYDAPVTQTDAMVDDVVSATWEITEAVIGGSDLIAAPSWAAADETTTFDNTDAAVFQFNGTDYTALATTGAATTVDGINSVTNVGLVLDDTDYVIIGDSGLLRAFLAAKIILQGPYQASQDLMRDQLRTKSLIPLEEPYSDMAAFTHVSGGGGETVDALEDFDYVADGDDIVDWVFLEIRDSADAVVSTRSALLQRDGDIIDIDGSNSAVSFEGITLDNYTIVVRHRNHLGVKSSGIVSMSPGTTAVYDFTSAVNQAVGDQQEELETGVYGVYGGNANGESAVATAYKGIRMTGPSTINDALALLNQLGGIYTATQFDVYETEDLNLDGNVRMTGPSTINDALFLLGVLDGVYTNLIVRAF